VMVEGAGSMTANKSRCYSCASDNMKENFLTRDRGPRGRVAEPKLFDSMCDLDTWMIREKSAEECDGVCFKWQQILNNSGVHSYATIRGCYPRMFGQDSTRSYTSMYAMTTEPFHSDCTTREKVLECIDQSTIVEHTCYCQGDYCNKGTRIGVIPLYLLLLVLMVYANARN